MEVRRDENVYRVELGWVAVLLMRFHGSKSNTLWQNPGKVAVLLMRFLFIFLMRSA